MKHAILNRYMQERTLPSLGLLAFRLTVGSAFVLHGLPKIQHAFNWMGDAPVPGVLQALAAFSEFGGGLALILGLLTPLAALSLIATMLGALFMVHLPSGHAFVSQPGQPSYELALVYLVSAVLILLNSPGRFSLDYFLVGKLSSGTTPAASVRKVSI